MNTPFWIWQQPGWPAFEWQARALAGPLHACAHLQGRLAGMAGEVGIDEAGQNALDALLQNIITSSAIEGEALNASSVRSSLARRLGIDASGGTPTLRSEGLAEMMLNATADVTAALDVQRLFGWHRSLFAEPASVLAGPLRVGDWRGEAPMQVVSGRIDRPVVHFQAPPRDGLKAQVDAFVRWFASSRDDAALDPLLRAGIAHFWFVTLHPFDDGNGRITRALTDLALAQASPSSIRLYAMSASILEDRAGYYRILEASQKGGLNITAWLAWFLKALQRSLEAAIARVDRVLAKARFWREHRAHSLLPEQVKVLNRLLNGGERGFEGGISAGQYQSVAKVSKATATRHLADLLHKGCLQRLPGGGRSIRYCVVLLGNTVKN